MRLPKYEYKTEGLLLLFNFESVGPKGRIKKIVEYSEMSMVNFYNLAFGDYDEVTGKIDDSSITNNNDSQMVLSTVASTLYAFSAKYPDAWVYATGSSDARTRLYRMGIANNLEEIMEDFDGFGLQDDEWKPFVRNELYEAFLVKRKIA